MIADLFPNNVNPVFGIFVFNQLNKLADCGAEISVVSPVPWSPPIISLLKSRWRNYFKIDRESQIGRFKAEYPRYLRPPGEWFSPYSGITCYIAIRNLIRDIYRRFPFDIIYSNALIPSGYASCKLAQNLRLPVICCVGESTIIHSKKVAYVLTNSTRIVSTSRNSRDQLLEIVCPRERIEVIYRGADTEVFKPLDVNLELKRKLSLPDDSLVITFVGWLINRKGVFDLVNAFSVVATRLSKAYLLIIGDGPERSNLEALLKRTGIEKRVIFTGLVKNEEMPSYYSITDVMAFPSYAEGLPNAVVEAVACGKPVVATNVGGIPEVVIPEVDGFLIKVGDIEGLYSYIMRVLTDRALMRRLGQGGRKIAENWFNGKKNAGKLYYLFQEVIQEYKEKVKT